MDRFVELGVLPVRHKSARGYRPHFSLMFNPGSPRTFSIDSTLAAGSDAYLVTHAHSDHYGSSVMRSGKSVCSSQTASALEIIHGKKYCGRVFETGSTLDICGVKVETFTTAHTLGATAFYWENEVGTRILVTGDIKDAGALPQCDVLVTEASYGDPDDPACHFTDDLDGFREAISNDAAFGAYTFGKAQRAVGLLRAASYFDKVHMDETSLELTRRLMSDVEPLDGLGDGLCIVPPGELSALPHRSKYVLTARRDYPYRKINISDHMDVNGLVDMVKKCSPEAVLVYHPKGMRARKFASHLNRTGIFAISLEDIPTVLPG